MGASRACLGPAGPEGLVCPRRRVRSATAFAVEVVPSRADAVLLPLILPSLFSSSRPRDDIHTETTKMVPFLRWRVLVGGRLGGAFWIVRGDGFLGVGRNLCWLSRHRRGDACGCHHSFLQGVGCTPSPPPSVYRGNPRTSPTVAALASYSLVKVLFGTRRSGNG